jgi:hypothetical protein
MGVFSSLHIPDDFKNPPTSAAYNARRGLTAAAYRVDLKKKNEVDLLRRRLEASKRWQRDAYDYTELIGEIDFASNMVANTVSKIRLYAGYITAEDTAPANIIDMPDDQVSTDLKKAALETLRLLDSGDGGISGLLREAALNLFIAGECYLVREPAPRGASFFAKDKWQIRSIDELEFKSGPGGSQRVFVRESRHDTDEDLIPLGNAAEAFTGRIWRPSPRYSKEATSSLRPQLENCDMFLLYERSKRSIVRSKLNAGILFVPDQLSQAADADGEILDPADLDDGEMMPVVDETDPLEEELIDAFVTPIQDETAVSAVAPLIVRGPAELGAAIKHITFTRNFDPQISTDAQRLLERILIGLDLPKEVVAGLTDAKYANAIVVEDNFYKMHIEPMILAIVDSLTVLLMRNQLTHLGFSEDEVARVVVWYDPSPVSTKPDKATAATTGYANGILSAEAWRRANGFGESDAPSGLEKIQRVAITRGLLNDVVTEQAMRSIAPELFDQIRAASQSNTDQDTAAAVQQALGDPGDPDLQPEPAIDTEETSAAPPVPLVEP